MTISSSNLLIIYRSGDSDSKNIAESYASLYDISPSSQQIASIPCSSNEILSDYTTFKNEVENPIKSIISSISSSYDIYVIVLCLNTPRGFYDGIDIVSSTSRLMRINHTFSKKQRNPLYNKKDPFKYSSEDSNILLICSRIDGPNFQIANDLINNTNRAKKRFNVDGTFYFDPYSSYVDRESLLYKDDLLLFEETILNSLNLNIFKTKFFDPYVDSIIPSVKDDSIVWQWGTDSGSLSFFNSSNQLRLFFYNADFDGGFSIKDLSDRSWPMLSLRKSYVSTACSMSNMGSEIFLRPFPFFNTLLNFGHLGESFAHSSPYFNCSLDYFGDPLLQVNFITSTAEEETRLEEKEANQIIIDKIAESISQINRKTDLLRTLRDRIALSIDLDEEIDLLYKADDLRKNFDDISWKNDFKSIMSKFYSYFYTRRKYRNEKFNLSFDEFLSLSGNKLNELNILVMQNESFFNSISDSNFKDEGSWEFEFNLKNPIGSGSVGFYHFELDIATDSLFENIIISKKSINDNSNWLYFDFDNKYKTIPSNGILSSLEGIKIKYSSKNNELLNRNDFYYFRIRQRDQNTFFDYDFYKKIIFS